MAMLATVIGLLVLAAFITLAVAYYKGERSMVWLAVLFLVLIELLRLIPAGR